MTLERIRRAIQKAPEEQTEGTTPQGLLVLLNHVTDPAKDISLRFQEQNPRENLSAKRRVAQVISRNYREELLKARKPVLVLTNETDTATQEDRLDVCGKCGELVAGSSRLLWAQNPSDLRISVDGQMHVTVNASTVFPNGTIETCPFSPLDMHTLNKHDTFDVDARNRRSTKRNQIRIDVERVAGFIQRHQASTAS